MQFESLADFINMGGYAFYVWLSFGVTFAAMAIIAIQSLIKHRNLLKQVVVEKERKARIKKARQQQQESTSL
ncbi:heme exporter protein CcmD [Alteromonas mediterranea]|uniref:Heme exporter protein D n=1 Tax=Alteromonas mediterranea TaxID=314275 RepID=A0AAC8XIQ2_9ALTE|nr:heme exporter protein CcmD [Alteromonas mediterranea]MBR9896809.1 heme exporter protein CcmD [Gammaproteobacteria bacterium]AFV84452.1 heme exporter protein CcmD [Alteromonas mediterranea DE1]AGP96459.1 heme exporter protein CcmD [Alteromonas mediterranea UM7]AGQ00795.1 heme exporter protein CcmD [Alteromonas mediterranea UM4b]AMJ77639.1 transcriptional regulator [Alteromonas mediterranea]|tara:strand:+ start:1348 stop:1563 length:216 start_codon:yes stop_codon:yes gene_type:complete